MAVFIHKKFPAQHAIYGGSAPVALELNPDNWETCAILRAKQYVYIGVGSWGGSDDDSRRYRVDASPDNSLSKDFASLDAALDYANNLGKEDKELPFKPSSGAYVGIGFGNHREGISIPLKEKKNVE